MSQERKDYYKYEELINGIRPKLLESQKLLHELNEIVVVDSKEPSNHHFELSLADRYGQDEPLLLLRVNKDDSLIGTKIRNKINKYSSNCIRPQKDHASFNTIEEGDDYYKLDQFQNFYYHPKPIITDQKEFAKVYKELKESDLYGLRDLFEELNPFQDVFVCGTWINLSSDGENGKGIDLSYDPRDDRVKIKSSKRYSTYFIGELLDTPIPKYLLPEEYRRILDESSEDFNGIYVDDFVGRRKESLRIEEEPKQLILKRK